jgi:hypothetical protein
VIGSGCIEFLPQRMAPAVEGELVVTPCLDPLPSRRHRSPLPDPLEQGRKSRRGCRTDIDMAHDHAMRQKMHMGIAQTRRRKTSGQVEHPRPRTDQRLHIGRRSRRRHAARPESGRFRDSLAEAAEHAAIGEDDVGFGQDRYGDSQARRQPDQPQRGEPEDGTAPLHAASEDAASSNLPLKGYFLHV